MEDKQISEDVTVGKKGEQKLSVIITSCVAAMVIGGIAGFATGKMTAKVPGMSVAVGESESESESQVELIEAAESQAPGDIVVAQMEEQAVKDIYEDYLRSAYKPIDEEGIYAYALYDIDQNGTSELLVGVPGEESAASVLKHIYVYNGTEVVDLLKTSTIGQVYNNRTVDENGFVTGYTEYGELQRVRICEDGRIIYTMKLNGYPTGALFEYQMADNGISLDDIAHYITEKKGDQTMCQPYEDASLPEVDMNEIIQNVITDYDWTMVSDIKDEKEALAEAETEESEAQAAVDYTAVIRELSDFFAGNIDASAISVDALREPLEAYSPIMNYGTTTYNKNLYSKYAPSYALYDVSGDGQEDLLLQLYSYEKSSFLWGALTIQDGSYVFVEAPEKYDSFNWDDDVTWPSVGAGKIWQSQYTADGGYNHVWVGYVIKDGKLEANECYAIYSNGDYTIYHLDGSVPFNESKTGLDFSKMTSEKIDSSGKPYVHSIVSDASIEWVNFLQ